LKNLDDDDDDDDDDMASTGFGKTLPQSLGYL
jgi:hypothetical protein